MRPRGADFTIYYDAGRALLAGHSPHGVVDFLYPPFFALALVPLALLPLPLAAALWQLGSLAALLFVARACVLVLAPAAGPRPAWLWWLPLAVCARLFDSNFGYGQANLLILALVVAALLAWRDERTWLAGLLAGTAAALKVLPGILLAYWLLRRTPRPAWIGCVTLLVLVALAPLTALSLEVHRAGLVEWWTQDVGPFVAGGSTLIEARGYPPGQSLAATCYRLLCDVPATSSLERGPSANLAALDPDHVRWVVRAATLGVLAVFAWVVSRRSRAPRDPAWLAEVGFVLCSALLVGPLVHKAHLSWTLVGVAAMVGAAFSPGRGQAGARIVLALVVLFVSLSTASLLGTALARDWLAGSGLFFGVLVLWCGTGWRVLAAPRVARAADDSTPGRT